MSKRFYFSILTAFLLIFTLIIIDVAYSDSDFAFCGSGCAGGCGAAADYVNCFSLPCGCGCDIVFMTEDGPEGYAYGTSCPI
jgi:hypothetical protein